MGIRTCFLFSCFCFLLGNVSAQDPHFSQFFSSPLTLNPAHTGKFFGSYRVAGNYRNQWPTINNAFTTATVSADFHIMQNKIASNDTWGLGMVGYNDNSANGAVKFNYAALSTAYHKGLDEEGIHSLGAGFQVTYANMLINTADLKFEDQLTSSGFTGVSSEVFNGATLKSGYIDVNAGVLYNGSTSDRNNFYFGVSMYHINRPKQTFTGAQYVLNPRTTFHGGGYFPIGETTTLHVSAQQMFQGGASTTMLGGAIQLSATPDAPKPTSFYFGSWVRFNDAIIPYLGLEFDDFRLGLTYDYNSSSLKTASQNRGGIELSLIYIHRPSTDRPVNCPKF
ncbi:MAG: type IX secretion system membrane protein PorP/SprF [Chitinophagaceae bacterium]|nr:MAG: type IX secretion system membrane protein PorP/SprF [Chitinophagaceae bacterium]